MERESFIFYRSFAEQLQKLSDEPFKRIMCAVFAYAFDGVEMELETYEDIIFGLIKPQLDANNKKYENGCKGAEFGKLGGRPKKPQENPNKTPQKPQENPTLTPNDNVNDNVNVNVNDKEEEKKDESFYKEERTNNEGLFSNPTLSEEKNVTKTKLNKAIKKEFNKPTYEEITSYSKERGREDLAKYFYDYFNAGNWVDSNGCIVRNWKQKFLTWEKHNPIREEQQTTIHPRTVL